MVTLDGKVKEQGRFRGFFNHDLGRIFRYDGDGSAPHTVEEKFPQKSSTQHFLQLVQDHPIFRDQRPLNIWCFFYHLLVVESMLYYSLDVQ